MQEKFAAARRELSATLIERDDEIDLVLTALVAPEHVLLVGPPGCAKSLLLDSLMRWLSGRRFSMTCPLPGLATLAQEYLDACIVAPTGGDVTRIVQRLFERQADLFAIREQGAATSCRRNAPASWTGCRRSWAG